MTTARFDINGSPSTDRGYDATADEVLTLTLEDLPATDIFHVRVRVFGLSSGAPTLSFTAEPSPPVTPVEITMPSSGMHAFGIEVQINHGQRQRGTRIEHVADWTCRRVVVLRAGGLRKMIPGEREEYEVGGWAELINEIAEASAALGGAALVPDYSEPPDAAGASGTYTSGAVVYSSSIDPAYEMSTSYVYDIGAAALAISEGRKMPKFYFGHGYSGAPASFADPEQLHAASKGFIVCRTTKRGDAVNPHSAGGADDARDRQDLVDVDAAIDAALPTLAAPGLRAGLGVSGGSYDYITIDVKYPGWWTVYVATQLGGDIGVNPNTDGSYWGSNDNRTEVEARVGVRASSIQPYRARNAMTSLVSAVKQSTTKRFFLWDAQDPLGVALRAAQAMLEASDAPRERWYCEESDVGSDLRWEHGYPATVPALFSAINAIVNAMRGAVPATAATSGSYIVAGHCVSEAGWECWTGPTGTANCKTLATGAREHVVDVRSFDAASGQFSGESLSGACAVTFIWGGDFLTVEYT